MGIIDLLLELGADINGPKGEHGYTIHYALMSREESVVRHLLDKGAAINDSDVVPGSIAMAILYKLSHIVPLLLDNGASLDESLSGRSPLALAFEHDHKEIFKLLLDRGAKFGDDFYTLEKVILERPLEDLEELLGYGLDPNIPGDYKQATTASNSNHISQLGSYRQLRSLLTKLACR
jgi:hypothetical protein